MNAFPEKKRVLWIEDGAITEVPYLAAPVITSGKYFLRIVNNVDDGLRQILKENYDVIIVDIRNLPGENKELQKIYRANRTARLGLNLLYTILKPDHEMALSSIPVKHAPTPEDTLKFGVLTVEEFSELREHFAELGLSQDVYSMKNRRLSKKALLELVDTIVDRQMQT